MMTAEEIREGIQGLEFNFGFLSDEEAMEILSYLHSQGVVIKVERELPKCPIVVGENLSPEIADSRRHTRAQYDLTQLMMLRAGYVAVENLIKEEK